MNLQLHDILSNPALLKEVPDDIARCKQTNKFPVFGYTSNLDVLLKWDVESFNSLLEEYPDVDLTKEYGDQLLIGILNLMKKEGIITCDEEFPVREPFSSEIGDVYYLNATHSGLFVPALDHCAKIKQGDKIGDVVDPLTGAIRASLIAPNDGILFTLREYPVVYEGSLIARIFGEK